MIDKSYTYKSHKGSYFIIMLFAVLFSFVQASAPEKNWIKFFPISLEKVDNLEYSIDAMQIRIIESNDKSGRVSVAGAFGNMQIMPVTLDDWNKTHEKEQYTLEEASIKTINIKIGTWMLEKRIPEILKSKNIPLKINYILIGYNWGTGNLVDWYNNGAKYSQLPEETQDYICKYWNKF